MDGPATVCSEVRGATKVNNRNFRVLHGERGLGTSLENTGYEVRPFRPALFDWAENIIGAWESVWAQGQWQGREPREVGSLAEVASVKFWGRPQPKDRWVNHPP